MFLGAVNIIGNGLRDVGYVLEKKLDSITAMTPESVEKNRAKAALIAEKLGPIVREVLAVFRDQPTVAQPTVAQPTVAQPAAAPAPGEVQAPDAPGSTPPGPAAKP